jgi:hypothetical protein
MFLIATTHKVKIVRKAILQKNIMNLLPNRHLIQISRFLIVGALSTILNYVVFLISLHHLNFHYLIANAAGFISGLALGYPLNKKWTFKKDSQGQTFNKYFVVYTSSLLISMVFLKVTIGIFEFPAEISNVFAIAITTCTNFVGTKYFVFGSFPNLNSSSSDFLKL